MLDTSVSMSPDQRQRTLENICVGPFKEFWGSRGDLAVHIDRGESGVGYRITLAEKGQMENFHVGADGQITHMHLNEGPRDNGAIGPSTPRTSHLDKVLQLIA